MPDDLPILFAARLPGGAWLVDASEALVTAQGAGAPVLRLDVAALVRVARAAGALMELYSGWSDKAMRTEAVALRAALAALGDSALLGKGE